jgi:hypothetical protein
MTLRKNKTLKRKLTSKLKTKRRYKGGSDFGLVSFNESLMKPNLTYNINPYNIDPSRDIISSRNLVGGKKYKKIKNRSRKKGGMIYPLRQEISYNSYGINNPLLA